MRTGLHSSLHHPAARAWQEPHIHASNLCYPIFVTAREDDSAIAGFAPNMQWGSRSEYATLAVHLQALQASGLTSVMLFGVVSNEAKDECGGAADADATPVIACLRALRASCPDLMLCADVCLCEYTDHGHCGLLRDVDGEACIDNAPSVERLVECAVAYARAGAHCVCPSDMMDGRVAGIRGGLDVSGFGHVAIMAYTSKKASCMYSPFRAAVESTFTGNRKRYQQPIGGRGIALRAAARDSAEGADYVLVKPALFYCDLVRDLADPHGPAGGRPVACYVVSGEYKMLKDYGESCGCFEDVLRESHLSLVRAGATILITYFAPEILGFLPKW